ncbi:MAG: ribulose-phosphate 3-epimerase [Planctomycetota bacterium]
MTNNIKIGVSILSADFACLEKELDKCERAGVDAIHLDVMDGYFVPNITFGPVVIKSIRHCTQLPMDAHLMIDAPHRYINDYIKSGVDIITLHAECYGELKPAAQGPDKFPKEITGIYPEQIRPVLNQIRSAHKKVYVALNPGSPLCIQEILNEIDGVLIMSVNPGFSGQSFDTSALSKIESLRRIYQGDIQVDGGVNEKIAPAIIKAGANYLVTASYFFSAADPAKAVKSLRAADNPRS